MATVITIDGAGRLVIPKELRRKHQLWKGTQLIVRDEGGVLVLEPVGDQCPVAVEDGLPVVGGVLDGELVDHRTLREERDVRLSGLPG